MQGLHAQAWELHNLLYEGHHQRRQGCKLTFDLTGEYELHLYFKLLLFYSILHVIRWASQLFQSLKVSSLKISLSSVSSSPTFSSTCLNSMSGLTLIGSGFVISSILYRRCNFRWWLKLHSWSVRARLKWSLNSWWWRWEARSPMLSNVAWC